MTGGLIEHFGMSARYNTLANRRLYEACAELDDSDRKRIRPAFFRSIHGTLNHILLGDRIWLARFAGEEVGSGGLDRILYPDFGELRQARAAEDRRIEAFANALDATLLDRTFRYLNNEGNVHADPARLLIAHLFNHQTHHRGQVHDMLSQTDVAPPSLDMHRVIRPDPVGAG